MRRWRMQRAAWCAAVSACLAARSAEAQTVAQVAAQRQCSTANVVGLSSQLVRTQECLYPGVFVRATPHANVTLTASRLYPLLSASARTALWTASRTLNLQVNSMFRTLADQYVLYYSGACGLAARPGQSNHESGRAVDLANWSAALRAMTAAGCTHPYPGNDDVHFDCPGGDRRADSVRTFQHLWNANNAADRIAEDGAYGPQTEARLARSPAGGFRSDGCAAPPPPPPPPPPPVDASADVAAIDDARDASDDALDDATDANNDVTDASDGGAGEVGAEVGDTLDPTLQGGCQCAASAPRVRASWGVGALALATFALRRQRRARRSGL